MSDECKTTGFTPQQVARWPNVHKHLCGTLELPTLDSVSEEVILNIGEGIESMLKSEGPTPKQLKARAGLFRHLKRTLEVSEQSCTGTSSEPLSTDSRTLNFNNLALRNQG